jgi:drug/metabolite transporter (DMT)-like permease
VSTPTAEPGFTPNVGLAIGLKVASVLLFLAMSTLVKATGTLPPGQLVTFRSLFAIAPVVLFLHWRGDLRQALRTSRLGGHLLRGLVGIGGMGSGFFALTHLPLPEATAINYATPIFIVILGALFLKEPVRLYRWAAVLCGLVGVAIMTWPRLSLLSAGVVTDGAAIGAAVGLTGALFAACAMITVRSLVATEKSATIVLYFFLSATVLGFCTAPFGWMPLSTNQWLLLFGGGVTGGIAQVLLTESYRHGDVSLVAPFEYSSLIFSLLIGYLFFGDTPGLVMLLGASVVIGSGLFIIFRERQLGIERKRAREAEGL